MKKTLNSTLPVFRESVFSSVHNETQENMLTQSYDKNESPLSKIKNKKIASECMETVKNQYKLDLTMEHNIIRAMARADKEQEALRDNSSLTHGFKRISAGMQLLRTTQFAPTETISTIQDHLAPFKSEKAEGRLRNTLASQQKWLRTDREKWIKSRGLESTIHDSRGFTLFLRQLFSSLDEDGSNKLTVDEIIFPMLAFGLYPDAYYIETALSIIFNIKDVSRIFIEKVDFESMFNEDSKIDIILKNLDICAKALFGKNNELYSSRCESAPLQPLREDFEISKKFVYCTVDEYLKLLRHWWENLRPVNQLVHSSKVGEFLTEQNISPNKHEGMRILKEITDKSLVSYREFEKVFLKSILKSALLNLASVLNYGELGVSDASLRLKLSNYERNFMIKGTSPDGEYKQGKHILQAVSKYQAKQPGCSRNRVTENIQKTVEFTENSNKERLKGYLFKLKNRAREFVNDRGDIMTNLRNTWEISNVITDKYKKTVSTVLDGEQTFDQQKYFKEITKVKKSRHDKAPVPRKIKAFRENYTLERYQKLIESPLFK